MSQWRVHKKDKSLRFKFQLQRSFRRGDVLYRGLVRFFYLNLPVLFGEQFMEIILQFSDEFRCQDGSCISNFLVCNGSPDCPGDDLSDEDCAGHACNEYSFQCSSGLCIPKNWGKADGLENFYFSVFKRSNNTLFILTTV